MHLYRLHILIAFSARDDIIILIKLVWIKSQYSGNNTSPVSLFYDFTEIREVQMLGINLDRQNELPLRRQIYQALRDRMTKGGLEAGKPLPSTRALSRSLNVSRSTVSEAYDMLIAEGFAVSRQGAPTRVAEGLCMETDTRFVSRIEASEEHRCQADFRTGQPDLRQFPRFLWQRMLSRAAEELKPEQYGYSGAQGLPELRNEIAAWLFRSRGLIADARDIFITQGATHALHLTAELLCNKKQKILMEDPCHTGMLQTFLNRGCHIVPVPADEHGIRTELLKNSQAGAVYVTPSHQFPLGGVLPASRRASLIRYARDNGAYIIEDDYDSEFRYCGEPIAPLQTMDPQRVIYVGTFSKSVYPALRVGYVILPGELQKQWVRLRTYTDVQNPVFEQAALSMFLRTRKLDRYVQKMRRVYGERRKALLDSLTEEFGWKWKTCGDDAGLHLTVAYPDLCFDNSFRKSGLEKGINITPIEYHCIEKGKHRNMLLIGYGHLEPDEIRKGIGLLRHHIEEYFR